MKHFLLALISLSSLIKISGQPIDQSLRQFLSSSPIKGAHAGLLITDIDNDDIIISHQSDKYFIPASNTKLFTLFAALKNLGDSLPGIRFKESEDSIWLYPTGDPTLLNKRITSGRITEFLKKTNKKLIICDNSAFRTTAHGPGWSVDDLDQSFMPERALMPVFGNIFIFTAPSFSSLINTPDYPFPVQVKTGQNNPVKRNPHKNEFYLNKEIIKKENPFDSTPFISSLDLAAKLLEKEIKKSIQIRSTCKEEDQTQKKTVHSEKTDSVLKLMMHESDNFIAEQLLLMTSLVNFKYMNEKKIIDNLLKNDLKDLPQPPHWIDGSGLSRYNLFTPEDFVFLLKKTLEEFGWKRISNILPHGGSGTLSGYYESSKPYLYAKTGSLSNNSCLSGILITKKNRRLAFSIMINNHLAKNSTVKRAVETFLKEIREGY